MDLARKDTVYQINDIREWQKKTAEFRGSVEKCHVWKESGITTEGRREADAGTHSLGNDKNIFIADKVIFSVYAPSLKCKLHVSVLNNNY